MSSGEEKDEETPPDNLLAFSWPEASPPAEANAILFISCGNSRLHWAWHDGKEVEFQATLHWRYVV